VRQCLCNDINNLLLRYSPHVDQTLLQLIHIVHFYLVDSLLICASDVVNWIEVMAVRRPQIWRCECMAVGFILLMLMRMVSLHTSDQDQIAACGNNYKGLRETISLDV